MANKIGPLIKKARTDAGLTQEQLAKKIKGVEAADISKAERGELALSQTVLKEIAKITGVTQSSLLTAAKESTYKEKKTSSSSSAKTGSSSSSVKLTAAEKKVIELYRKADADKKKAAVNILKGETPELAGILGSLLNGAGENNMLGSILNGASELLGKK